MPKFDARWFLPGVSLGGVVGAVTGAAGAAITGSNIGKTTTLLASGMGIFFGICNFSGPANPSGTRPRIKDLITSLAINEFWGGTISYVAYRFLIDTAASALPIKEFALSMIGGYPVTLGLLCCAFLIEDYLKTRNNIENTSDAAHLKVQ
jgi:hypothetical protein